MGKRILGDDNMVKNQIDKILDSTLNKELISFEIFGKRITLGTPHRMEIILIFTYMIALFQFDVLNNKVLDLGVDYRVTWFGNITSNALDFMIVPLIVFHLALMGLFLMSLKSTGTHKTFDIFVGTLAFLGVAIVLAGFINSIYSDTIRFMFVEMKSISFYHIGIFLELGSALYWSITK